MTITYSDEQIDKARRILQRDGWEYQEDRFFPTSDSRRKGWWVNVYNPDFAYYSDRRGDSKDYWYQTQQTYRLYSGHSDSELN